MHGARVVDARAFAIDAAGSRGPMLLAQCDIAARVLRREARAARSRCRPTTRSRCCSASGCPTSSVFTVALADLDRDVEPDHLTSLFVDTGDVAVGRRARAPARARPNGCAARAAARGTRSRRTTRCGATCSRRRTRSSRRSSSSRPTRPAATSPLGAYDALEDELGDLLFQVMIQSVLAAEAGAFTVADVARAVHAKLVRRHPHVFGDVQRRATPSEVVTNWEQIKKAEKDDAVARRGRHRGLARADRRAEALPQGRVDRARARRSTSPTRCARSSAADPPASRRRSAPSLAAAAAFGREHDVDAESALASWARRYKDRFRRMEQLAAAEGVDLAAAPPEHVRELWDRAAPGAAQ